MNVTDILRGAIAASALSALLAAPAALGQPAAAPAAAAAKPAFKMPVPVKDYKASPAGKYAVDQAHTGVIARVSHVGFSYSVFRFTTVSGTLTWDPANPGADAMSITVDPKSIATANTGGDFSGELSGQYLKAAQFPTATFVSKAFHVVDATHGSVDGDMTIMGVTKPVTFDVELVGAGQAFKGPVLGVHAETDIHPAEYGLPAAFFSAPIRLIVDTELDKQAG
ncbi:MAG: YceI family protein [Caulobacterales bacterium]